MPNYDVNVRDKIAASIPKRLRNIASSAGKAAVSVKELREQLNLVGKGSGAAGANALKISQDRVRQSAIRTATAQNSLTQSLDRTSISQSRLTSANLAVAASQNRATASAIASQNAFNVTAIASTRLSASEQRAALAANRLAISNNKVRISAIQVQIAEQRLIKIKRQNAEATDRQTRSTIRNTAANRKSIGVVRSLILNIRNLLAVYGGFILFQSVSEGADTFRLVENRLKTVSTSTENQIVLQRELNNLANDARVPILELATSYARFDKSLSQFGISQKKVLDFTETITKQLKLGGASVAETESVLRQLSQALNAGRLNGQEFNAILENAPIAVMQSFADVLGVSRQELKKLGSEGKITSEVVLKGIQSLTAQTRKEFLEAFPFANITESLTIFSNKFAEFLSRFEKRTGFFQTLGGLIVSTANNLDRFGQTLLSVGAGFTAFKGLTLLRGLFFGVEGAAKAATASTVTFGSATKAALLTTGIGALAVGIGLLVAYRNEIKLSEDGVVSLGDVATVQFNNITNAATELASNVGGSIADIFEVPKTNGLLETWIGIWGEIKIFTGTVFNDMWEGGITGFQGLIPLLRSAWTGFLVFMVEGLQTTLNSAFNSVINGLVQNPLIASGLKRFTGISTFDIGKVQGSTSTNIQKTINALKQDKADLDSTVSEVFSSSEERKALFAKTLREDVGRRDKKFLDDSRKVAEARLKQDEDANAALAKGNEELNAARVRTAKDAESQITKAQENALKKRQANLTKLNVAAENAFAFEETKESNFLLDQHLTRGDATQAAYESTRQEGNEFFKSLSQGYTNLITKAGEYRVAAQESLGSAAEGLGKGLAGDKSGFADLFRGLFNSFIDSKNADFNTKLASAGPGKASTQVRDQQADAQGVSAIGQASQISQQQVQALDSTVQALGQSIAQLPTGKFQSFIPANVSQSVNTLKTSIDGIKTSISSIPSEGLTTPFNSGAEAAKNFGTSASSSIKSVSTSATQVSEGIGAISSSAGKATSGISSFASSAVESLDAVTKAANRAAEAQASIGSGGGGGGGGGLFFDGFMRGGYTGNGRRNQVAGAVHGQEYVFDARSTKRIGVRNLEALRSGTPVPSSGSAPAVVRSPASTSAQAPASGSNEMKVVINNNAPGVVISQRQISRDEVQFMVEQAAEDTYNRVAGDFDDPNSDVSQSFQGNYLSRRSL